MGKQLIVLSSITYAYKARDYLEKKGIKSYIDRIPTNLRKTGCGYGLKVNDDPYKIAEILKNANFKVKDIFEF